MGGDGLSVRRLKINAPGFLNWFPGALLCANYVFLISFLVLRIVHIYKFLTFSISKIVDLGQNGLASKIIASSPDCYFFYTIYRHHIQVTFIGRPHFYYSIFFIFLQLGNKLFNLRYKYQISDSALPFYIKFYTYKDTNKNINCQ